MVSQGIRRDAATCPVPLSFGIAWVVGPTMLLSTTSCTTDRVAQAQSKNLSLLTRAGVLRGSDHVIFRMTMAVRASEADNAPFTEYLTRVELVLPGAPMSPTDVQAALESRAVRGGFKPFLRAAQGGLQPACYRGFGVQLCILVAALDDPSASAEISVDTDPRS